GSRPGTDRGDQSQVRRRQEALSRALAALSRELLLQHLVHLGRVGLAFAGFHHLAHQEVEGFLLARAVFGDLRLIGADDGIDDALDLPGIGNLPAVILLDDLVGARAGLPHALEYFFRDLAGDGAVIDPAQQADQRRGRYGRLLDAHA